MYVKMDIQRTIYGTRKGSAVEGKIDVYGNI